MLRAAKTLFTQQTRIMNTTKPRHGIMMVRPANFGFNAETAESNVFQCREKHNTNVQELALQEFDSFVSKLKAAEVPVVVVQDTHDVVRPDAIFPNNWISFHDNAHYCLFPMLAPNRRAERRTSIVDYINQHGYSYSKQHDFTHYEQKELYCEGTGSMVFDYKNRIAYASISSRLHPDVCKQVCATLGYEPILFSATDDKQQPIYHTNVLMCVGSTFAVVCSASIASPDERTHVINSLTKGGKEVVDISHAQMCNMAGNMLEVTATNSKTFIVLSSRAHDSLTNEQRAALERHGKLLHSCVKTIETYGGGSVRCMMAELRCED